MRRLVGGIGVGLMTVVFLAGVLAYFFFSRDQKTGITYDGLGRRLSESPLFMQWVFGEDRLWAGWLWFVADMVIFWSGILIGIGMTNWASREPGHVSPQITHKQSA